MVNLSLNWASISGLLLMALWVPALVVSLRRFDLLMDRDQPSARRSKVSVWPCF